MSQGCDTLVGETEAFTLHTDIRVGPGVSVRLPEELRQRGIRRVAVIVDAAVRHSTAFNALRERLAREAEIVSELTNAVSEPDYDYLEQCRGQLQGCAQDLQALIGIGGGSTLDLTKALSVLMTNPGPAISYRGFNLIQHAGVPVVALPTTAGTGAEVTPNAVFTDRREQRRLGINTPLYVPKLALLDPLLTRTCPRNVTIASGLDALMQAIESFASTRATPISRMFSQQAFALVFHALPEVVRDLENVTCRGRLQIGAYYSGIALMNASSGPAGALSYPLGLHFRVPHGLAHAIPEPTIAQWNVDHGYTGYAELYDAIEDRDGPGTALAKSQAFCERLAALYVELGVHQTLGPYGVTKEDISLLGPQATLLRTALESNPISLPPPALTALLERML